MIKVILPSNYGFSDPVASLVPIHRNGLDDAWFTKRASVDFQRSFDLIKPADNHSLIHLIAMGATDTYGPNRNGDAFYKSARHLDLVDPNWSKIKLANGTYHEKSAATFADHTNEGLIDTHSTFSKYANVFKHHKNKAHKGDKVWGAVKAAAYNEPMDRVELLIDVPNDEWRDDLQKLAEGKDIPFSMACVTNPATLVLTSTGYKPIATIARGDVVLSHRGNWCPVTGINRRKYTGKTRSLSLTGHPFKIELTADHPMLATTSKTVHAAAAEPDNPKFKSIADWVHTEHLGIGNFLMYMPPKEFEAYEPIHNPHIASALGEVICGTDNSNITKVVLAKYIGEGRDFYLGLFNSPHDVRLAFLGALIDGVNGDVTEEGLTWIDIDGVLVLYVRDLFMSVGISCEMKTIGIETAEGEKTIGYMLMVGVTASGDLLDYSAKMNDQEFIALLKKSTEQYEPHEDKYYPCSICEIEEGEVENVTVYNIEVEGDESYLIAGFVSHNCKVPHDICSVCGHKAKDREHYCSHLTTGLTDMLKTGHVVSAVNADPTFFDISRVERPADRIAWSLVKAASDLVRAADLPYTEEYGFYAQAEGPTILTKASQEKLDILRKAAEIEKQVPCSGKLCQMKSMVKAHKEHKPFINHKQDKSAAFNALINHKVCLPLDVFAEFVIGSGEKVASIVEKATPHLINLFTNALKSDKLDNVLVDNVYDYSSTLYTDLSAEKTASSLERNYGLNHQNLVDRVVYNSLFNNEKQANAVNKPLNHRTEELGNAEKELLEQYTMYKLAFLNGIKNKHSSDFVKILELSVLQNTV